MPRALRHDIRDPGLAAEGVRRIDQADRELPVLRAVRDRFGRERPLAGIRISACLPVDGGSASLARTLQAGGADVVLCASSPRATLDDVAAALVVHHGIGVFAARDADHDTYYAHVDAACDHRPQVAIDEGSEVIGVLHAGRREQLGGVLGATERTGLGIMRLRALEADGALAFPVVDVGDGQTSRLLDSRYGTGQATLDAIVRATNQLIAGRRVVVVGYGACGRGVAERARGMGAHVIVSEVAPIRAVEATLAGFDVMPMDRAATMGDVFVTATGCRHAVAGPHIDRMKDGAILANAGHSNVEIELAALRERAVTVEPGVRQTIEAYTLADGRTLSLLAEGRPVNLAGENGQPSHVVDAGLATEALAAEHLVRGASELERRVYGVPDPIDQELARLQLASLAVDIDTLTEAQRAYLSSWDTAT